MEAIEQVRIRVMPDGKVSRKDAAAFLGRAPKTLAEWSVAGRGPKPIRVGGRCFYKLEELQAFAQGDAAVQGKAA